MSNSKLIIPKKIKVGFQNRQDTYTKKLAYVIYIDDKGVLRKEGSWNSWRDHKIDSQEYDNTPTPGFVLNKKVGDYRGDWGCHRQAYIRVYDPRDFEFEIDVNNLLFILEECSSIKGKGLEGDFVYAWDGKDLVLLPTSSADYQNSVKFTELQTKKINKSELKDGCTYVDKNMNVLVYLGRHNLYSRDCGYVGRDNSTRLRSYDYRNYTYKEEYIAKKTHVFEYLNNKEHDPFSLPIANIKEVHSNEVVEDYAERFEKFKKSKFGCQFVPKLKQATSYISKNRYEDGARLIEIDDVYYSIYISRDEKERLLVQKSDVFKIDGNKLLTIRDRNDRSEYLVCKNGKPKIYETSAYTVPNEAYISKADLESFKFHKIVWQQEKTNEAEE